MPFSPKDIRRVGEILAFAARTEIMPRFRRLTATQVREKSSPLDLVTEADEVAEAVITTGLKVKKMNRDTNVRTMPHTRHSTQAGQ
jgi:fructose-1,6-bisphosphatase/inositol monophosphatase family enzyme